MRERIEHSDRFRSTVAQLAASTGRSLESVREEAVACLKEMVAAENTTAADAWGRMGDWLLRGYEIDADTEALAHLRAQAITQTLVFLPNHRSYLDPFVLRSVLDDAGFPPNYVLGGSNLSFFPLGQIGQRTGLVFIRREFRNAPVYRAMLGVYLEHLVDEGADLEWYIEGGRTRTGKLRPPRMGILSYLLDAFASSGARDITFVPVSIVYDQQHEVEAIAAEESGGTKKPESIKWALRYARAQGTRRGKAHVRFAEPISLREILDETHALTGSDDVRQVVPKVAFEVSHRINEVTPITASAIVALMLLDIEDRALTEEEMRRCVLPMINYIRARNLPVASGMNLDEADVLNTRTPSEGRQALQTLVREGVVRQYSGGLEPVYSIPPDRVLEAAFYRNTLSHFFVTRSIVELALVRAAQSDAPDLADEELLDVVWTDALRLRDLLKYEFFFSTKGQFADEVRTEMDLLHPGWEGVHASAADLMPALNGVPFLFAHRIVGPFLEAYAVLADRLAAADPTAPIDADALVAEALGVAQQRVLQRQLATGESVSKDLFKNALELAGNRGLLEPAPDVGQRRAEFAAELAAVVRRVGVIRRSAAMRLPGHEPDPGDPAGPSSTTTVPSPSDPAIATVPSPSDPTLETLPTPSDPADATLPSAGAGQTLPRDPADSTIPDPSRQGTP